METSAARKILEWRGTGCIAEKWSRCMEMFGIRLARRLEQTDEEDKVRIEEELTKLKSDVKEIIWPGVRKMRTLQTDGVPITSATETSK